MKKLAIVLLATSLVFGASACGKSTTEKEKENTVKNEETSNEYMTYMEEHHNNVTEALESVKETIKEDAKNADFKTELKEEKEELQAIHKHFEDYKNVPEAKKDVHTEYVSALKMGIEAIDLAEANDLTGARKKIDEAITKNHESISKYDLKATK